MQVQEECWWHAFESADAKPKQEETLEERQEDGISQ